MRKKTRAERVIMKSSVAKHYGCKRERQCGLIANGRTQANRDFFLCKKYELLLRLLRSNKMLKQEEQSPAYMLAMKYEKHL